MSRPHKDRGNPDVEAFMSRLLEGAYEIDHNHQYAKELEDALDTYRKDKIVSIVPTERIGDFVKDTISTAMVNGAIKTRKEYFTNLARQITIYHGTAT
jgi:hypothetical protein